MAEEVIVFPMSFAQQRIWFTHQLDPSSPAYNVAFALRFSGPLESAALLASLVDIQKRHEVLRTTYALAGGEPVQVISEEVTSQTEEIDLSSHPSDERELRAKQSAAALAREPFELSRGPLVRSRLIRLNALDHVLVVVIHHIAADGWSLGVLQRELAEHYRARVAGRAPRVPELPVQYADFASWQREWLQGAALESQLEHWRTALKGLEPLELPTDRPRAATPTWRAGARVVKVPDHVAASIRAAAKEQSCSVFMIALAAFKLLLHRWTGQRDIAIGSPIANRNRREIEGLIGFFVNNLVLRTRCRPEMTLRDLVAAVRDITLGAYANQDLPFEKLVEELHPERLPNRHPLFQIMFAGQNAPMEPPRIDGVTSAYFDWEVPTTRFDLEVHLFDFEESLSLFATFSADLFDDSTIDRLLGGLVAVLEALPRSLDRRLEDVPIMSEEEHRRVLVEWNSTARPYELRCLHELVEAQVARDPDAVAIRFRDAVLTYRELDRKAGQLAREIVSRCGGRAGHVGVLMERSLELVVALLAVLKAGGAYAPLDPEHPQARLASMVEDLQPQVILTQSQFAGIATKLASPSAATALAVDTIWAELDRTDPLESGSRATLDDVAYVIFTSGSTGKPKGVLNTHAGICNRLLWMQDQYQLQRHDKVLQKTPFGFDVSVWEFFWPLIVGAELVVAEPRGHQDPRYLARTIAAHAVTTLHFVPSMLRVFLGEAEARESCKSVRQVFCSGEALAADLPPRFFDVFDAELHNLYGPTEAAVDVSYYHCQRGDSLASVPIGRPVANTQLYVLDANCRPVPIGVVGDLYIGGIQVAKGYLNRPELTQERFVADPYSSSPGARLYRTGDRARFLPSGDIDYRGRDDFQVKIRGNRIELPEIEAACREVPDVTDVVVIGRQLRNGEQAIVAYYVAPQEIRSAEFRRTLGERLPQIMLPSFYVRLDAIPTSSNGKLDRAALPDPEPVRAQASRRAVGGSLLEQKLAAIWRDVLGREKLGADDNFFDLGGHSLQLIRVREAIERGLGVELSIVELFANPTIASLARRIGGVDDDTSTNAVPAEGGAFPAQIDEPIAIVGIAGRFPGAGSIESFWEALRSGREGLHVFSDDELREAGIPERIYSDERYVRARGVLDDAHSFDSQLFGVAAREADLMDPQHRVFLEVAWEALERAAYDPARFDGAIGVFAGCGRNSYALSLAGHPALHSLGDMQTLINADRDYLPTRVSYKLNLRGPSVNVQSACSTSLVAVHLACQSLRAGDCDLALAGGVTISVPLVGGYVYQQDGILSPDGHCRAFDADAQGTVGGSAAAIVVLQRLSDAIRSGSIIHAVIRGSAINNDGSQKVGFTAPGVSGQEQVISRAHRLAGGDPASIGLIEAHGTGTKLGDPIEMEALSRVFGSGAGPATCAIGSVKTNIGHVDTAAGAVGLIKAALCVKHREIVPSLHFKAPNPEIDLDATCFYVPTALTPWIAPPSGLRRAAVSSFGIGGTNAHVVLEEAPTPQDGGPSRRLQLLTMSGRTPEVLDGITARLGAHLQQHPEANLADIAHTLQVGRRELEWRRVVVAADTASAVRAIAGQDSRWVTSGRVLDQAPRVVFMFPGQGAQFLGMFEELHRNEPVFRDTVDECARIATPLAGFDFRQRMWPLEQTEEAKILLTETLATQLSVFAVEFGLAKLWLSWGVQPAACIGHSIGEYVAAAIAGTFELEDALRLVVARGALMGKAAGGSMLAVPMAAEDLEKRLVPGLWLSAINARNACVIAGHRQEVESFEARLRAEGVETRRLQTSGAFHSGLMQEVAEPLTHLARSVQIKPPQIPVVSNVTGTWVSDGYSDPSYWAKHLLEPVKFAAGVAELLDFGASVFLEVGPGKALCSFVRRCASERESTPCVTVPSLGGTDSLGEDVACVARATAQLWTAGVTIAWDQYRRGEVRRRLELPTYPFVRKRHWLDPVALPSMNVGLADEKLQDPSEWFYVPQWQSTSAGVPVDRVDGAAPEAETWIIFEDEEGIAAAVADALASEGQRVVRVRRADAARRVADDRYEVDPSSRSDFTALLADIAADAVPTRCLYAWPIGPERSPAFELLDGFEYPLQLLQSLVREARGRSIELFVLTSDAIPVLGTERLVPARAAVLGLCRVAPQEHENLRVKVVDIDGGASGERGRSILVRQIKAELSSATLDTEVALRGSRRWIRRYQKLRIEQRPMVGVRENGVYVVTGGLGTVGFTIARALTAAARIRLILVARTALPPREHWANVLATRGPDDTTAARIRRVMDLEQTGAEVLLVEADVADEAALESLFRDAESSFGSVDGVIHAAGVVSGQSIGMLQTLDIDRCREQFRGKVHGAIALSRVLARRAVDFCVLTSSLSTVLGGLEFAAYASANCTLGALAVQQGQARGTYWVSVEWDGWLASDAVEQSTLRGAARYAMTASEGGSAFGRVLSGIGHNQLIVSTGDLESRLMRAAKRAAPVEREDAQDGVRALHSRPDLSTPYVAPADPIELAVCATLQEMLGIQQIGVNDDFFELGGDSLLAVNLMFKLSGRFEVQLSTKTLFTAPTVSEIAKTIRQMQASNGSEEERERAILELVEGMSDEEVRRLLASEELIAPT